MNAFKQRSHQRYGTLHMGKRNDDDGNDDDHHKKMKAKK